LGGRLFGAGARGSEPLVSLPAGEGPAFAFAEPLLRRLEGAGLSVEVAAPDPPRRTPGAPVQIGLPFDESEGTRGRAQVGAATPREVSFLSAPGEEREAEEIVGCLLEWARAGIRFHEMAVLARRREPHPATL